MSISGVKDFFKKNEAKIALLVGFLLVSSLSFEVGSLWGQKWQQQPLIIEKQSDIAETGETARAESSVAPGRLPENKIEPAAGGKCAYVGSKNSTKFYLSTCAWAKQIKPENVVCFASQSEAISKGRTESICKK